MIKSIKNYSIIFLMLFAFTSYSQKSRMTGLWEAINVNVGENNMTPVAKWFRFNPDGTTQSGNGWLKNYEGNWQYDSLENKFSSNNPLGIKDEFGAFDVSFDKDHMYWEREEEGMNVKVTLRPIEKLPMSPADYLQGIWLLESIEKDNQSIMEEFDPNGKHYLHIRWDRIYRNRNTEGERLSGYWHINGHRPEITFLPHSEGENAESWKIEVNEENLIMTGISDSNDTIVRKYRRGNKFPR
ncbi:hypothetical protein [Marivirga arenosa]|uniref:Lipocalin-like domain-containing protein n=1 Tax=Marivirga arenosa TaxID=3059076 RepID=A0AA51ZUX2_9BACT|nr:hypothetical protein [Marivirga sp. BKB1-2]WNB17219.1 hypothetical protein QYS47_33275 [Marivirga sp. BKB1-2]